jgi:hypothetical protein
MKKSQSPAPAVFARGHHCVAKVESGGGARQGFLDGRGAREDGSSTRAFPHTHHYPVRTDPEKMWEEGNVMLGFDAKELSRIRLSAR